MAGIAAGYGVDANGKTFSKDYSTLSTEQVRTMSISPGSAPGVRLSALRVFGCSGSSLVSGQALDRVFDPNNDSDFLRRGEHR